MRLSSIMWWLYTLVFTGALYMAQDGKDTSWMTWALVVLFCMIQEVRGRTYRSK